MEDKRAFPAGDRLNPTQAALYLGVSRTVFNRTIAPKLPVVRLSDRKVSFKRSDLDSYVESVTEPPLIIT